MSTISLLALDCLCSGNGAQSFLESYLTSQSRTSSTSVEIERTLTSVDEHTNTLKSKIEYCTLFETEIKLLDIGVLPEVTPTCTGISHF
jgi:hypothetical protein